MNQIPGDGIGDCVVLQSGCPGEEQMNKIGVAVEEAVICARSALPTRQMLCSFHADMLLVVGSVLLISWPQIAPYAVAKLMRLYEFSIRSCNAKKDVNVIIVHRFIDLFDKCNVLH